MEVMYVLLPVVLVLAAIAVAVFLWAVRAGQFDDLTTPAVRLLHDDVPAPEKTGPKPSTADPPASLHSSSRDAPRRTGRG